MANGVKQKIIVIVGPTASGKSDLAVSLARKFNGEVISADSRQVYRGLNIGTGKITKKEMCGIPHHLLDVVSPRTVFTANHFKKLAEKKIREITGRGKIPIVVGGTGLYIDVLLEHINIPEVPPNMKLRKRLEKKSVAELFALLKKLDPKRTQTIEKQNPRRLIRAIEIARTLGAVPAPSVRAPLYNVLWLGIMLSDDEIKTRIANRLTKRMHSGMVAEAKRLHKEGLSWKRMHDLGLEYRYLSLYLHGSLTKEKMVEQLQTAIWQYARRQKTWFKKNKEIRWVTPSKVERSAPNNLRKIKKVVVKFLV